MEEIVTYLQETSYKTDRRLKRICDATGLEPERVLSILNNNFNLFTEHIDTYGRHWSTSERNQKHGADVYVFVDADSSRAVFEEAIQQYGHIERFNACAYVGPAYNANKFGVNSEKTFDGGTCYVQSMATGKDAADMEIVIDIQRLVSSRYEDLDDIIIIVFSNDKGVETACRVFQNRYPFLLIEFVPHASGVSAISKYF